MRTGVPILAHRIIQHMTGKNPLASSALAHTLFVFDKCISHAAGSRRCAPKAARTCPSCALGFVKRVCLSICLPVIVPVCLPVCLILSSLAQLYGTHLGEWQAAASIAEGLLDIPPQGDNLGFGMEPLTRIEAALLLARCRAELGKPALAREPLEQAIQESDALGYVWLQAKALRDKLHWAPEDADVERLRAVCSRLHEPAPWFD